MEPMGHFAGMVASVLGGISTVIAACIAAPVGLMFNGTILPLAIAGLVLSLGGWTLMQRMARIEGR